MSRSRRLLLGLVVLALLAAGGAFAASNYTLKRTTVRFRPGERERGLNTVEVRGPAGKAWILYSVVGRANGGVDFGGYSAGELPVFGADATTSSTSFPDSGETKDVPTGQHVKVASTFSMAAATALPTDATRDRIGTWIVVLDERPAGDLERWLKDSSPALAGR